MRYVPHIAATLLLFAFALTSAVAAQSITGTWTMEAKSQSGKVDLALSVDEGDRTKSHDRSSQDIDSNTIGITQVQLDAPSANVTLSLVRDAGSIVGPGTLVHGSGAGTFTFSPSATFEAALHERGYADLKPRELLILTMLDVRISYVDEIASAGYPHLKFDQLIALRALEIDGGYIRRVESHGIAHPSIEQLISLKALDIVVTPSRWIAA